MHCFRGMFFGPARIARRIAWQIDSDFGHRESKLVSDTNAQPGCRKSAFSEGPAHFLGDDRNTFPDTFGILRVGQAYAFVTMLPFFF